MNLHNVLERFLWTFIQAAVGAISVAAVQASILGVDLSGARAIGLTALGAGVAAVLSLAKNLTAEGIVAQSAKRSAAATEDTPNERYIAGRLADTAPRKAPARRKAAPKP